jgi:hypothetical protein
MNHTSDWAYGLLSFRITGIMDKDEWKSFRKALDKKDSICC